MVIELLVLQALASRARGDTPAALAPLRRAVTLAGPMGHVRVFLDEGPPMTTLLQALIKQGDAPQHAGRLLAPTGGEAHRAQADQGLVDPLGDRELEVLGLLGSDLDGLEIARELVVSLNTVRTHAPPVRPADRSGAPPTGRRDRRPRSPRFH